MCTGRHTYSRVSQPGHVSAEFRHSVAVRPRKSQTAASALPTSLRTRSRTEQGHHIFISVLLGSRYFATIPDRSIRTPSTLPANISALNALIIPMLEYRRPAAKRVRDTNPALCGSFSCRYLYLRTAITRARTDPVRRSPGSIRPLRSSRRCSRVSDVDRRSRVP